MPDQHLLTSESGGNRSSLQRHWFRGCVLPAFILAALFCWLIEADIFAPKDPAHGHALVQWSMKLDVPSEVKFSLEEGNLPRDWTVQMKPDQNGIAMSTVQIARSGRYRSFSIAFADSATALRFEGMSVRTVSGRWSRTIGAAEFESPEAASNTRTFKFDPFLRIADPWEPNWAIFGLQFVSLFAFFAALLHWGFQTERAAAGWRRFGEQCRLNPRRAVFAAAVLGVVTSCYPIIFCGMSWVSPSAGLPMIYHKMPTVPIEPPEISENPVGSDAGATLSCHWPMVFQAHRAVFEDGEMPLWNRYSWCGISQVGQFFHMWGDPLHWLPIATGGASWAWDVKVLLTRLLYAFGCGLLVLRTCGSLRVAAVLAVSACFHGFFMFRTAHVAVFAFAYMPWVLLAWVEAARAGSARGAIRWAAVLALASWQGLNGGTAKEATLTIAGMNLVGVIILLASSGSWRLRLGKLAWMSWGNLLLLLISAPLWMLLLDSLRNGFCQYQIVKVHQLQPGLAIGLFDEIFQRQVTPREFVLSCGANFLILLGTLWSLASFRTLRRSPVFLASAACVMVAATFVFGAIPAGFLAKIPVLQTVYHFDVTFSFLLFTPLLIVAGMGLREMWQKADDAEWKWTYLTVAVFFAAMYGAFLGYTEASHREGLSVHPVGTSYYKSIFFLKYAAGISLSLIALPWLCRAMRQRQTWAPTAAVLSLVAFVTIHFRMGSHLKTSFDHYAYNPKSRYDYNAMKSPGLEFVKDATHSEPWRVYGLNGTLVPGFAVIPRIETICGPEAFENRNIGELFNALHLDRNEWVWRIAATTYDYAKNQKALDFIGVRYLLSDKGDPMPNPKILPVIHQSDLQVGESKGAWPRAFFTDAAFSADSAKEVASLVLAGDGRPFAAVSDDVAKLHASLAKNPAGRVVAAATNYRLTNNSTAFDVEASSPGLAVLHETNVPGDIIAKLDGEVVPCINVNGAFRGVWIEKPGHHRVEFTFAPRVWFRSLKVAFTGIGLLLLTIFAIYRTRPVAGRSLAKQNVVELPNATISP